MVAAAWLLFPLYAQSLLDRLLAESPIEVELEGTGIPTPFSLAIGSITATAELPAGACAPDTAPPSRYRIVARNARLSWLPSGSGEGLRLAVRLAAESVSLSPEPSSYTLHDRDALVSIGLRLSFADKGGPRLSVDDLRYPLTGADLEWGALRLEGISYHARIEPALEWATGSDTLSISTITSNGTPLPVSDFRALFSSARDPLSPCSISLHDCSVQLAGLGASAPLITYDLRSQRTAFTLRMEQVPLESIPPMQALGAAAPLLAGTIGGSLPITFSEGRLRVEGGTILIHEGASATFRNREGKALAILAPPPGPLFEEISLEMAIAGGEPLQLRSLSSRLLGGTLQASPVSIDLQERSSAPLTLALKGVRLPEAISFTGDFGGRLKGTLDASLPLQLTPEGVAIQNARLFLAEGGTLTTTTPETRQEVGGQLFRIPPQKTDYHFGPSRLTLDRSPQGALSIGFSLAELRRKAEAGELVLNAAKGKLRLFEEEERPSLFTLEQFSAGLFGGRIAVDRADYDMEKAETATNLTLSGIPLQSLIELQGNDRLSATGAIGGSIPVKMSQGRISVAEGRLLAEKGGRIVYLTTPAERQIANPGLKTTYEALSNFFYIELSSLLAMDPEGNSRITLQLRGSNPDFQAGRRVELNLTIEQNLLELMQSLTIPAGVEQLIMEQAAPAR